MAATPYLSANRYKVSGYGMDTSSLAGPRLTATLRRSTTMVNAWCNAQIVPQEFDFRGGTITNEQHTFPIPNPLTAGPGSRRIFVYARPLRTVTAFALEFTNSYRITLPPSDLYINKTEGFAEIVASQPTIIGYPPLGYLFGLYQPIATISYTYGYSDTITDDLLDAETPRLFYGSRGSWDRSVPPVVKVDGVVQTTGYTVSYIDGSVTFAASPAAGVEVTASYSTTLHDAIAQATGIIATDLIGQSRIAARGMVGLQSVRVAEVALTALQGTSGRYVTRNGVSIPAAAAQMLGQFALGKAA